MAYFPSSVEARRRDGYEPDDPEGDLASGLAWERQRAHAFVRKRRRRWGAGRRLPGIARDITLSEFESMYAAADFALASGAPLDVHVTLNFALLGISCPAKVQEELDRFLKCYGAYARGKFPAAWLYSVEMGLNANVLGYHAHIALHVPGATEETKDAPPRRAFRKWVREYGDKIIGKNVARAVKVSCSLKARPLAHWLTVTYLLKGYDQQAVVQSGRSAPDGVALLLGDLIPFAYSDPGPVATTHRVRASHSLGPKRREIGAPSGMEHILPLGLHPRAICISGIEPAGASPDPLPLLAQHRPFRSKFEDGVRDVRELYSHELYQLVAGRPAYEPVVATDHWSDCLTCQLRAIADEEDAHAWKWNVHRGLVGYGED